MSCRACKEVYVTPYGTFNEDPSYSEKYKCFIHTIVEGTGKSSLIVFCNNDPRARRNPVRTQEMKKAKALTKE
jgi:hypothetical protein